MIKLGACAGIDRLETAAKVGFDFVEFAFSWIAAREDAEFEEVAAKVAESPIKVEACNIMIPKTMRVTGPDVDEGALRAYLEKTFARAARLGMRVVVFGSGGARGVPAGFPYDEAWRQLAAYLKMAAPYAREYNARIAIEPLFSRGCNICNFVSEGTLLAALVNDEAVGVLADTQHMSYMKEPFTAIEHAGAKLYHVHDSHVFPDCVTRNYPYEGDGNDHAALFETLKGMGYEGRVSIEADCADFETDGARAVEFLRKLA